MSNQNHKVVDPKTGKTTEQSKKAMKSTLIGAAFIMATSAIGPGFLTQTATFTNTLQGTFGFVILTSVICALIIQLNVWRVLCVSGLRGQDVANKLLPGLGYFVAFLIVLGGIAFNIGNVGGAALGFEALLGIPTIVGYFIAGVLSIAIFLLKDALKAMDTVTKVLGAIMIVVILAIIVMVGPPFGTAIKETFMPVIAGDNPATGAAGGRPKYLFEAFLTLLGGTVGGYITFAGAHRLIDAGITGEEKLYDIKRSSVMGISIAALVRILLFLAVLGVVVAGATLGDNPVADAFRAGAGELGARFAGLVLLCAALTSVIGAAYTSVSFLKTFHPFIEKNEKWFTVAFIAISTVIMAVIGRPASLLVLAGALNGLILPVTLGVCLFASKSKRIMGEDYKHPMWLFILGLIVTCVVAYMGITSLSGLANLFS